MGARLFRTGEGEHDIMGYIMNIFHFRLVTFNLILSL